MKTRAGAAWAVVLAIGLAGCGGGGQPAHSASVACRDFQNWFLGQNGNIIAGKAPSLLTSAVREAPSGQLYQDMSTLQSDVATTASARGSSLAIGEKTLTIDAASTVEQDCQSVNTG